MRRIAAAVVLVVWAAFSSAFAAADVGVTLKLDRDQATLSDSVRLEVSVSGSRSHDSAPVVHGLKNFVVTDGGTSSRLEIINGKMNAGLTFTYFLQPKKVGTFTIGPAAIRIDGRVLQSNRATLSVRASSGSSGAGRGPVFIEAGLSAPDVFVGQQALYTVKLYHRVAVDNLSLSLPQVDHLDIKKLGQPREYETIVAGRHYQVVEIRCVLTAERQGKYTIEPSRMQMTVTQTGPQFPFDDFFKDPFFQNNFSGFASGRPLTVASDPLQLRVRALPEKGRPAGFSGLVGNFRMETKLDPDHLKAGESATLTVKVSGRGNVNRIPDLKLPKMPQVRIYGDQPVLKTGQDAHGFTGTKTMKWALVPEKPGRIKIPDLSLSFFNPKTGKYSLLQVPVQTLSVRPGASNQTTALHASPGLGAVVQKSAPKEIQQIGKDILPIHTNTEALFVPFRKAFSGWRVALAVCGPLSMYLLLVGGLKLRSRSDAHSVQQRSRKALKTLIRRCRAHRSDCVGLIGAFKDYLNDRFALSIGTLTADETEKLLRAKGIDSETREKIRLLVRRLEDAVYAGQDYSYADAADELSTLVAQMEKKIR